ncbi:hypothetical protein HK100_003945, partial [Physocladia obscura]
MEVDDCSDGRAIGVDFGAQIADQTVFHVAVDDNVVAVAALMDIETEKTAAVQTWVGVESTIAIVAVFVEKSVAWTPIADSYSLSVACGTAVVAVGKCSSAAVLAVAGIAETTHQWLVEFRTNQN